MRKSLGTGLFMVVTTVVMFVPPVIAHAAGYPSLAGALVMPTVAAFLPALLADTRTSIFAAGMVSAGSAAAVAVSGNSILAGLTMAAVAFITGLGCHWGRFTRSIVSTRVFICRAGAWAALRAWSLSPPGKRAAVP